MSARHRRCSAMALMLMGLLASGCITAVRPVKPDATGRRTIQETPPNRVLDKPSVQEFLSACDYLARDLAASSAVQGAERPIVIEIKPMEDRTQQELDLTIYAQAIREKLMNMGHGMIAFRDEEGRDDILDERIDQSGTSVQVLKTESSDITGRRSTTRPGRYIGPGGTGTPFKVEEKHRTKIEKIQQVDVSSRIAEVDYFLKGFVYLQDERTMDVRRHGFRYYRFQFRLTDARTGLMVWERAYDLKNEGVLRD